MLGIHRAGAGGLARADAFLKEWVPLILASPAYQKDGLLLIVADEANIANPADPDLATACCGQGTHPGPNTPLPGIVGQGGGRQGALVLSREGLFYWASNLVPEPIERGFHAIGSGGNAALGALLAGAQVKRAVEIATEVDTSSGGEVVLHKLKG